MLFSFSSFLGELEGLHPVLVQPFGLAALLLSLHLPPTSVHQAATRAPVCSVLESEAGRSSRSRNRSRSPTALADLIAQASARKPGNDDKADGR